ncbi:MAG: hypothetical protein ABFS56_17230 [Pseudomonadota bacterium]
MRTFIVIAAIALLPISTVAADFSFTPRVMVGVMNFEWEQKSAEITGGGQLDDPISDAVCGGRSHCGF